MAGSVLVVANDVDSIAGNGAWLDAELYIYYYRVTWGKAPPRGKAPLPSNYKFTYASGSIS